MEAPPELRGRCEPQLALRDRWAPPEFKESWTSSQWTARRGAGTEVVASWSP